MAKNSQNRADSQKSEPSEIDGNPQARKQSRRGSNSDPIQSAEGTNFLVVGIGASAGGVQALKMFFTNVPADSGNAYVVILHLSPDHESHLAEILYSTAGMPVTQVIDSRVRVEPNHIYVISPNHGLEMTDGYLEGTPVESQQERRAPVDLFFRTLAESRAESAVSVILSGTGPDGSMGVKRIKEMGGIVIAQDPEEAQYRDMPRYSIRTGLVDFILPVAEIPAKINEYRSRVGKALIAVAPEETPNEVEENVLADILLLLRTRSGHDFTNYKRATVLRRVERRMNVQGKSTLSEYAEFLREHDQESHALLKDLLISVTNFFRDADAFHLLEKEILPKILDNKSIKDPVRAWVPACATGEEAYSFAMLFAEQTSKRLNVPLVQIFATDIDEEAIVHARSGLYSEPDVADVSPARLQQFFQREGANYRVRREIREMVLFATHNVLKDPPFSRLELVSCRNLLIYLNSSAQKQLVEMAHFALKPGGYLFLGSSESVEGASDLFRPISKEFRVFQGRPISQRSGVRVPELSPAIARNHIASAPGEKTAEVHAIERLSFAALHQNLLEEYAAPSLVVNDEYEIVHVSPRAGRYLQIIGGEPSNNLLNIARPELRLELRTALYQGAQRGIPVSVRGVPVKTEDGLETVNLVVRPVTGPDNPNRGFMLVIFEPAKENEHNEAIPMPSDVEPIAKQLEKELVFLKSKLSSTVEQYEIQQEELKASNEELQAINEELRSSGEELEMSREELQSVNEELSTVNQELKIKIEELSQSNNDFQNLINSTSVGTIFLDRQMRVNLFTETASEIFNLIPGDIGRPLLDLRSSLQFIDLVEDVQLVLKNLERVEREVSSSDGRHYLMRIMPYRSDQDRIDGVVMAFVDISSLKNSEDELLLAKERLLQALNIPTVGVIFFDNQTRFTGCNDTFLLMTGYGRTDIESGRLTWKTLIPPEWEDDAQKAIRQLENPGYVPPYEKEYIRKDGSRFYGLFAAARVNADEIVEYVIDISESKQAEKELKFRSRLLDTVQQSIIATDLHGNVIYWNRQAEQMFGWKADEVMGKNIAGITVPKYSAGEAGEIMSRVKGGESWDGEFELTRRDGTTFQAHVFNSPVRDRNGNVTGIVGVSIDLSQRKET